MDELIEGKLHLKRTDCGWRHYIRVGPDDRDIHCGAYMEVQLGEYEEAGGRLKSDRWLPGRYEAALIGDTMAKIKAWLEIGTLYPVGDSASIKIPLGTMVRVRK
jgi:hypothetical protein